MYNGDELGLEDVSYSDADLRDVPEMRHPEPGRRVQPRDLLVYGLEIAGHGGHWVEFSRPMCDGEVTAERNASQPPLAEIQTIAASGSSTIRDSQTTATPT